MNNFRDRNVLILGGMEFIGSNLAIRLVSLGARVTLVDSMLPHFGGNLTNIAPIAERCRAHNPDARLIFASTRQLYGRPRYLPVDENHPTEPVDVNGVHKLAAEKYYAVYAQVYGMRCVSQIEGTNARIGEIQAAILRVKLRVFSRWLARRRRVAALYDAHIRNPEITLPPRQEGVEASYHQYVVRCRDHAAVIDALKAADIGFGIHYPTPVHRMPAYAFLGGETLDLPVTTRACQHILSLPIHEALTDDEALEVAETLNHVRAAEPSC